MQIDKAERIVRDILAGAGVTVGGSEPWDITVHDRRFYPRLLKQASLGLGESYMDGWWETPALEEFIGKIVVETRFDNQRACAADVGLVFQRCAARVGHGQSPYA